MGINFKVLERCVLWSSYDEHSAFYPCNTQATIMLQSLKNSFFAILAFGITQGTFAGTGLETTRVIFAEKDRNQSVVAFNTDKNSSYLAQSWVETDQGKISPDFVVTPPILKLRPEQKNTIQITKNAVMKPDQETLYWLNVKFVAPVPANAENILKFSMIHRIKLIHRPTALSKFEIEEEAKKVTWAIQNDQLILNNPTAFYINISKVEVDGKTIKSVSYVAPHAQQKIPLGFVATSKAPIKISFVNDYGKSILLTP